MLPASPAPADLVRTMAQYCSPSLIVPQLRHKEPAAVVGELCATLHQAGRVLDPLSFFNSVISHEMLSSTVTSPGWALPHGRVTGLKHLSMAVGRSASPIRWFGAGAEPVHLVFLFAVPQEDGAGYLALLSGLARFSQNSTLLSQLARAVDSQAIFEILQQVSLRRVPPGAAKS